MKPIQLESSNKSFKASNDKIYLNDTLTKIWHLEGKSAPFHSTSLQAQRNLLAEVWEEVLSLNKHYVNNYSNLLKTEMW